MDNNYVKYSIPKVSSHEIIIAELSVLFDVSGFEENASDICFYIQQVANEIDSIDQFLNQKGIECSKEVVADENWNKIWESSFSPIEIDKFCRIRASFHDKKSGFSHEVLINPEMAFGTGHHETTYLMIKAMSDLSFLNKSVLDYGCGTGVLAIIAEQEGASKIVAVDIDQNAIDNSMQNFQLNHCTRALAIHSNTPVLPNNDQVDILLANINRNVLLDTLSDMILVLKEKGQLLISGLLQIDKEIFLEATNKYSIVLLDEYQMGEWVCLHFQK